MKKLLFLAICFLSFSIDSLAQASETFDIAMFQPPTGWKKQVKDGVIVFTTSNEQKGSYALITLFASGESTGDPRQDFEADWQEFILKQFKVKGSPEIEPAKTAEGWTIITGGAAFENDLGPAAVLMNTYSGHGRAFSAAVIFNSPDYLPAIEAFASSIKLGKPAASAETPTKGTDNSSVVGTWGISIVVRSTAATSYSGTAGSTIKQYTFNGDGTYSFAGKTFSFSHDKLLLIKESGSYQISGDNITVSPQKSVTQSWSKKDGTDQWGRLLTTQNRTLEKVTYRFTKNYSIGMKEWSLVLQATRATQRDGPFNGGTAFDNAWIYSPPCDKCFIEMPGQP